MPRARRQTYRLRKDRVRPRRLKDLGEKPPVLVRGYFHGLHRDLFFPLGHTGDAHVAVRPPAHGDCGLRRRMSSRWPTRRIRSPPQGRVRRPPPARAGAARPPSTRASPSAPPTPGPRRRTTQREAPSCHQSPSDAQAEPRTEPGGVEKSLSQGALMLHPQTTDVRDEPATVGAVEEFGGERTPRRDPQPREVAHLRA